MGPVDITQWVGKHLIKLQQTLKELKEVKKLLEEKTAQADEMTLKIKELEERLASRSQEIKFSSN